MALREEQGELNEKDDKQYKDLKRQAEDEILRNADVICTTCVSAFDQRLKSYKFKQVLIDEATQATEPETLIPHPQRSEARDSSGRPLPARPRNHVQKGSQSWA